jgi:hypothetical protein
MINQSSTQIKVTIPKELYFFFKSRADKFGLNTSSYLKHLIINDVKDIDLPTFKMSEKTEKKGFKALGDYKSGKTKEIKDVDTFFDNL